MGDNTVKNRGLRGQICYLGGADSDVEAWCDAVRRMRKSKVTVSEIGDSG